MPATNIDNTATSSPNSGTTRTTTTGTEISGDNGIQTNSIKVGNTTGNAITQLYISDGILYIE